MSTYVLAQEFVCETLTRIEARLVLADSTVVHDLRDYDAVRWVSEFNEGGGAYFFADRVVIAYRNEGRGTVVFPMIRGCATAMLPANRDLVEEITDMVLSARAMQ